VPFLYYFLERAEGSVIDAECSGEVHVGPVDKLWEQKWCGRLVLNEMNSFRAVAAYLHFQDNPFSNFLNFRSRYIIWCCRLESGTTWCGHSSVGATRIPDAAPRRCLFSFEIF
jgi:hypothetical protein